MTAVKARYRWYRAFFLLLPAASACTPAGEADDGPFAQQSSSVVGRLQNTAINEASGLARSQRYDDVFWVINDEGPSVLYAIDGKGRDLGVVRIRDTRNRDWEDLASFSVDGVPYIAVAAIGDNEGKRKDVHIDIVEEPGAGAREVDVAWRIEFRYPDGPRDAESLAIDLDNERMLVLTKRDSPARLYSVPLQNAGGGTVVAESLGTVASLPQPGRDDVERAPREDDWFWQPTGMDIAGSRLVVLTYGGVYLYERRTDADWPAALLEAPRALSRSGNPRAEAITFDAAAGAVYITIEQAAAPLYRLALDGGPDQ